MTVQSPGQASVFQCRAIVVVWLGGRIWRLWRAARRRWADLSGSTSLQPSKAVLHVNKEQAADLWLFKFPAAILQRSISNEPRRTTAFA
jgi:hypothetical protein